MTTHKPGKPYRQQRHVGRIRDNDNFQLTGPSEIVCMDGGMVHTYALIYTADAWRADLVESGIVKIRFTARMNDDR